MSPNPQLDKLINQAKRVSNNSYSPYSNFKVGSAFEDQDGNIFQGCNVENLAFPSGLCAERTAIVTGVSEVGISLKIKTLVVYTPTKEVTSPCGACRQVISEFSTPETMVICVCDSNDYLEMSIDKLLPIPPNIDLKQGGSKLT